MVAGRQYSVSVIKRLLWSRRWMIVIPFVVLSSGAIAFSYSLRNLYQSETTILLIPQRVPETYVRTTVTTRLEDRPMFLLGFFLISQPCQIQNQITGDIRMQCSAPHGSQVRSAAPR